MLADCCRPLFLRRWAIQLAPASNVLCGSWLASSFATLSESRGSGIALMMTPHHSYTKLYAVLCCGMFPKFAAHDAWRTRCLRWRRHLSTDMFSELRLPL